MTGTSALNELVEAITVDSYDIAEQMSAFHSAFTDEVSLPVEIDVLGMPVQVVAFNIREDATRADRTVPSRG